MGYVSSCPLTQYPHCRLIHQQWGLTDNDKGGVGWADFIFPINFTTTFMAIASPDTLDNLTNTCFAVRILNTNKASIDSTSANYVGKYYVISIGK